MEKFAQITKIAVLRANALGDYIFVTPALDALKAAYPEALIWFLGKKWHKTFLAYRPSPIDTVISTPYFPGVNEEKYDMNSNDFFDQMQKEHFDIAIQLHGGGRYSNTFINRLGAKYTVGLRTEDAPKLDINISYQYYQSEVIRYLEVVNQIGCVIRSTDPVIEVTEEDRYESQKIVSQIKGNYVVIHPGVTDIRRRWPVRKFAQVGKYLEDLGFRVIFTGTNQERYLVEEIFSLYPNHFISVVDQLSINGLTGLLSQAILVIANDTGPLHLADAIGTPTIGIYWCANVITGAPFTRKNHRLAISWLTNCPICHSNCAVGYPFERKDVCPHETSFVDDVTISEVKTFINDLIDVC